MARIAWRWEDLSDGSVVYMPINPNEGASPNYEKNLTTTTTTAPGNTGAVLIFEGADTPSEFSFSGVLLTQAHYEFIYNLWTKRHLLRLTDDLGRTFVVYLKTFAPARKLSYTYPWKHTYQASAVIVEHGGDSH